MCVYIYIVIWMDKDGLIARKTKGICVIDLFIFWVFVCVWEICIDWLEVQVAGGVKPIASDDNGIFSLASVCVGIFRCAFYRCRRTLPTTEHRWWTDRHV